MLGCFGIRLVIQQRDDDRSITEFSGLIGFDSACEPARSGPRMWGYLVNAPCKTISANAKRTDFALAA